MLSRNMRVPMPVTVNEGTRDFVIVNDENKSESYKFFLKNDIVTLKTKKRKMQVNNETIKAMKDT